MTRREALIVRETGEVKVRVELAIDGSGRGEVSTGIGMLDHLISQIIRHGLFDIKIVADGDIDVDMHHTVEDVAISLGKAFNQALGERRGIVRMAHAIVPMDEALAMVALDIGGRGYAAIQVAFADANIGELPADLVRHFLESLAIEAKINLHALVLYGINDHHKAEALFKGLGRALDEATKIDTRITGDLPSTKGII